MCGPQTTSDIIMNFARALVPALIIIIVNCIVAFVKPKDYQKNRKNWIITSAIIAFFLFLLIFIMFSSLRKC